MKILSLLLLLTLGVFAQEEARILRYPNTSNSHITFTYAGDVYTVHISGGLARKITSDIGIEQTPRFSPDGTQIAFTGEYEGNREIYLIDKNGGEPTRVSYSMGIGVGSERMGPSKIIMHWTPDGKEIVYRSRQSTFAAWSGNLFKQSVAGGLAEELPIPSGGFGYLSPDGNKLAYNRVFREYRTWKRYRGGQADDIWIYDFNTKELLNISNDPSQDIIPMWAGNKIYYCSDRNGTMNIYSYDISSKQTKKITNTDRYDVKFPSLGAKHISFSMGGYIYLLDLATDEISKVSIQIKEDFPSARPEFKDLSRSVSEASMSPKAERLVVGSRGDIFSVAAEKGNTKGLVISSNSHERDPSWSPDGKWIAYISDESGEDEVYLIRPDGSEKTKLTNDAESYRFSRLEWSPDSKKILVSDKALKLYYYDVTTKKRTDVRKSTHFEISEYNWSPDSKWITFTDYVGEYFPVVYLYNLDSKKTTQVTDEFFQSYSAVFTPGGNYLLFVSDRTFRASLGQFEWNFQYNNMAKIYGVTLKDTLESPFKYEEDLVAWEDDSKDEDDKEDDNKKDKKKDDVKPVNIDLEGIQDRIFEVPVEASNYRNLYPAKDHKLYYTRGGDTYYYDFVKKEENKVGDFANWGVSEDGKKIIIVKDGNWYLESFGTSITPKNKVDFGDMEIEINHKEEWKQIFYETWRQMKYFFYDPNMHGVNWDDIKTKYEVMLPHVNHRDDLTYIMGEMISELNVGHAYVGGGEAPRKEGVGIGLLGAEFAFDNNAYKITNIFEGRNWDEKTRSPLTQLGSEVKEGDYLIAVDGEKLDANFSPYQALVNKVNKWVEIEVSSNSNGSNSKKMMVKTIRNEAGLRYFNWVEGNRRYVDSVTGGRIGYVHIPDMGVGNGLNEFVKYFYPQTGKEALIIDDRYNGGGNVSPMIIERLKRELALVQNLRNQTVMTGKPAGTMTGPMVCLINELSASDGDLFPYQFKKMGLGPVIGKRSWGGVIGIRGSLPFIDGGYLMKPEFAHISPDGEWILENKGMVPDIEVDNHPAQEMAGVDQQLDKAIEVLEDLIKKDTKNKYPDKVPDYDDRSKDSYKK